MCRAFIIVVVLSTAMLAAPSAAVSPPTIALSTVDGATSGVDGELAVESVEEISAALSSAQPGDVIVVADGEYLFDERLVATASGSPAAPITLRGTRSAMLRTEDVSDDYGLHVTGDHWRIEGLTIAYATKGIVLDGSIGTVIDGVEVHEIGDEGVHFRSCSSDGVLRNSFVHDTGRDSPQYGEGVYVGSANSNWSDFECTDPIEGLSEGDNTERALIEGNVFEDITAEAPTSPTATRPTRCTTATARPTSSATTASTGRSQASASACTRPSTTSSPVTTLLPVPSPVSSATAANQPPASRARERKQRKAAATAHTSPRGLRSP